MARSFNNALRALVRRTGLVRNESGSIAVEFALICPMLFVLVGGVIEGGMLLYTWGNMEHISRQAARAVAVGAATQAEAKTFIDSKMRTSVGAMTVTATVSTSAGATPLEDQVVVRVTVAGTELAKILPFGIFRLTNLESNVSLRLET
jgi:Flp pilus assembly protein TadG